MVITDYMALAHFTAKGDKANIVIHLNATDNSPEIDMGWQSGFGSQPPQSVTLIRTDA